MGAPTGAFVRPPLPGALTHRQRAAELRVQAGRSADSPGAGQLEFSLQEGFGERTTVAILFATQTPLDAALSAQGPPGAPSATGHTRWRPPAGAGSPLPASAACPGLEGESCEPGADSAASRGVCVANRMATVVRSPK